jgi:ribosomal protein L18E
MLVTLWLLVGEVLGLGILPHKVAVVRVDYAQQLPQQAAVVL